MRNVKVEIVAKNKKNEIKSEVKIKCTNIKNKN
jgi:hypothetical protein